MLIKGVKLLIFFVIGLYLGLIVYTAIGAKVFYRILSVINDTCTPYNISINAGLNGLLYSTFEAVADQFPKTAC